jgi:hypothetical protein
MKLFRRGDIAARIVEMWPKATWEEAPDMYEDEDEDTQTPWEGAWASLVAAHNLMNKLYRVDVVSGIGRYGGLFLGLPGGTDLAAPGWQDGTDTTPGKWVTPPQLTELAYVRVVAESGAPVHLDSNPNSNRFGEPLKYNLNIESYDGYSAGGQPEVRMTNLMVHWTRMVHVADNLLTSEVFGMPRMERGLNRIMDIRKVMGGSGEMFWKGGFPGLAVQQNSATPVALLPEEVKELKAELGAFQEGLQRYLALTGLEAKVLAGQVSDPTAHLDGNLRLLAIAYDIPMRILMGAEAGQLASGQDTKKWLDSVGKRRVDHAQPVMLMPLAERLMRVGVLPPVAHADCPFTPDKTLRLPRCKWPDLYTQSEDEKADVLVKRTNALSTYVSGNAKILVPPLEYLIKFMGFSKPEAAAILEAALDELGGADGFFNKVNEHLGGPGDGSNGDGDGQDGGGGSGGPPGAGNGGKPGKGDPGEDGDEEEDEEEDA